MDSDLESLTDPATTGAAATVVLLRDGERGVEVLLAERPRDRGSFAGAWVFPGGAVDEADAAGDPIDGIEAARRAAVRETREEVGLEIDPAELVPFSHWTPPKGSQKQLTTTFFAVRVPDGELRLAPDEVTDAEWLRPVDALERHAAGAMTLWPPTWVTLHGLQHAASVDAALAELRSGEVRPYVGRFNERRTTVFWQEDDEYDAANGAERDQPAVPDDAPDAEGRRHRLVMDRLPWVYLHRF
ncbi:NUDIX hydrolase [Agromyces albus]|uniref:NUDIX domain-containing protein n=1 Tax=Agromyces albus TaxID=205332 RepID=A0A4Q2L7Q7_9MICO|nr:NUDIX domain-containing protein [Agromyces albus]RXZ73060.1 NUDIX domain-containing protein [Agromyces albus]